MVAPPLETQGRRSVFCGGQSQRGACARWILTLLLTAATSVAAAGPVQFAREIQPVLKASCYQCHGPERHEAGLRLDSRAALLKGGANGPAIVPGRAAE